MAELLEPRPGAAGRHVGGNTEEPMGHGEMKSYFDEPSLDYEVTETLIDDGVRVELAQIAADRIFREPELKREPGGDDLPVAAEAIENMRVALAGQHDLSLLTFRYNACWNEKYQDIS